MATSPPIQVHLRRNLARALRGGHPWLFAEALELPAKLPDGTVVEVTERGGRFLARGMYDARSAIAVRVWTTDRDEAVDGGLVRRRVASAWEMRRGMLDLKTTDCFRLLHGEADGLPGIVCDIYGQTAVLRLDTPVVARFLGDATHAVREALPDLRRILCRPQKRGTVLGAGRDEAGASDGGAEVDGSRGREGSSGSRRGDVSRNARDDGADRSRGRREASGSRNRRESAGSQERSENTRSRDRSEFVRSTADVRELDTGAREARDARARRSAGSAESLGMEVLFGRLPTQPHPVREHGMTLEVDLLGGHKTGLYLDQRENRLLVRNLARGRRVLDVFAYTGGFALAAALGGAAATTLVDVAAPAIEAAKRNFLLNGLGPDQADHRFLTTDAFAFLEHDKALYDLVVLDPPSMAPAAVKVERAVSAYRRLNALALARLAPGGLLVTASCSSHITEAHLLEAVRDAAATAGRNVRLLEHRGAGPDHPTLPGFPEGRYLNVLVGWVD